MAESYLGSATSASSFIALLPEADWIPSIYENWIMALPWYLSTIPCGNYWGGNLDLISSYIF